ncbi:MAG: tetratricopeptide repeat protein [Phycisphaeraceae bacterium]
MDSERRHELETNDLKEFLDNFKDFWEKHGNKLLMFLIVVLGGYAGYNYYNRWQEGKAEEAQQALEGGATSPDALAQQIAIEHDRVHDEAMRRAGDLYLAEARAADIKGKSKDADKALDKARSAYTALVNRGKSDAYKLAGHEGLAMVAIEAEKWDEAKSQFAKMKELAGDRYLPQAARAQAGPAMIDLIRNPVAFAAEDDLSFDPDAIPEGPEPDTGDEPAGGDSILDGIDLPEFDSTLPPVQPVE